MRALTALALLLLAGLTAALSLTIRDPFEVVDCGDGLFKPQGTCDAPPPDPPPPTGDPQYALWTPDDVALIQARVTGGWPEWETATADLEDYCTGGTIVNTWENLVERMVIGLVADPAFRTTCDSYYKTNFMTAVAAADFTSAYSSAPRDSARQHMADFAFAYIWLVQHLDANYFNASEVTTITNAFNEWIAFWAPVYSANYAAGTFVPQDSDESIAICDAFEVHTQTGLLTAQNQSLAEGVRDTECSAVESLFFDPSSGVYAEGLSFESNNYANQTPGFALRWMQYRQVRGATVSDPQWSLKHARYLILTTLRDPTDDTWEGTALYNDPINQPNSDTVKYNSYSLVGALARFRHRNTLTNAMVYLPPANNERRVLLDMRNDATGLNGEFDYDLKEFRTRTTAVTAADPTALTGVPLNLALDGRMQTLVAKSEHGPNGDQVIFQCWVRWITDHWSTGGWDLYDDGVALTRASFATNLSDDLTIHNQLMIENIESGPLYGFPGLPSPTLRAKENETYDLGKYADSTYATLACDERDHWNVTGWQQTADYATLKARRYVHFFDGQYGVVFDSVDLDNTELDDIDEADGYQRAMQLVQRFEETLAPASGVTGWTTAVDQGKAFAVNTVIADGSTSRIVRDADASSPSSVFEAYETSSLRTDWTGAQAADDVDTAFVYAYGDSPLTLPTIESLTIDQGPVMAVRITGGGTDRIVIQNTNPLVDLTGAIQVTSATAVAGAEVYVAGIQTAATIAGSGNQVTVTVGSGTSPNNGRVVEGAL